MSRTLCDYLVAFELDKSLGWWNKKNLLITGNPRTMTFAIGTFNVRGLAQTFKQQKITIAMKRFGVDICVLQETKFKNGVDKYH